MKMKIKLLTLTLVCCFTLCCGCQSVLIPEDKPIVLDQNSWLSGEPQNDMEILAYDDIGTGTVQDIAYDGSTLLILNPTQTAPVNYNIDLLRYTDEENRLTSFLSSEKKQLAAAFDPYAKGIFYVEETVSDKAQISRQLVWTTMDKSTTKTISAMDENVNPAFCVISDSQVLYTNGSRNIVFANANGSRQVYTTTYNLDIHAIVYLPHSGDVLYTAQSPSDENKTNLYRSRVKDGKSTLTSTLVDENVLDLDLDTESGMLFYIKLNGGSREIMRYNTANYGEPTAVAQGNFTSVTAVHGGEKILYSQYSSTNSKSSRSIWIMDSNGKNPLQLSAPLTLTSKIVAHPFKSTIYFSAEKTPAEMMTPDKEGNTGSSSVSTVFKIDYNIK